MAISKVILNGTTLIDVTSDTVAASNLLSGYTATKADGESVEGSIVNQGAQTITPRTTNQTIASGKYLSGTQTILGDADLVAGNIKDGTDIFGVIGTFTDSSTVASGQVAATSGKMLYGYSAWVDGVEVQGTIPSQTAQTITPGTTDKTIASGKYLAGTQTIKGDADLTSENIKYGTNIFGVSGTFTDASTVSSGQTAAVANKILSGYSAWIDGEEVKGSIASQGAQTITPGASDQTIASGKYLSGTQTIKGDADLVASNIKDGTDIFGVTGTFTDASTVSSGQIAANANTILSGYSAWVDGAEVQGSYDPGSHSLQAKEHVSPTESSQTIEPDSGYYGLSYVQIDAVSSSYVGSAIDRRDDTDLTASGATVTVPAGYYADEETKSVSTTTHPDPTISFNNVTGLISASHVQTEGYVSADTSSKTLQVPVQAAQTITPGTSDQMIASEKYLTGIQTIKGDADLVAGNIKDGTDIFGVTGTFTDSSTVSSGQSAASSSEILSGYSAWVDGAEVKGSITSQAAQTITPGTTDQTIASGKYLSGTQTILGDADLIAENIVDGTDIFGVIGTFTDASTVSSGQTAASANEILSGYSAWVDGAEVQGSISTVTHPNPSVDINTSTGLITASHTQTAGHIAAGDTKTALLQLNTQGSTTITPGTTNQIISPRTYLTGALTIQGDSKLIPSNIVNGVTIFGVTGTASTSPTLQSKSVTPSGSTQVITADSGYDGLSSVTVDPVPVSVVGTTLVLPAGVITV